MRFVNEPAKLKSPKKETSSQRRGNISSLPASDHVYHFLASQRTFEINFAKTTTFGGRGARHLFFLGGGEFNKTVYLFMSYTLRCLHRFYLFLIFGEFTVVGKLKCTIAKCTTQREIV